MESMTYLYLCTKARDNSFTNLGNLPKPDGLAEEIIENLEAGLESFRQVLVRLESR